MSTMTDQRGLRDIEMRSEATQQMKSKTLREEMNLKRKMQHYEKDFNIHVSRITSNERHLRESMRAYSDRMSEISRNTRARQAFVLSEDVAEPVDEMPLLVRAKHIPRHKPLTKLKGERERLDMLRDHLSRSFEGSERTTPSVGHNDDHLRRSLPNMKLNTTSKNKQDYKMKLASAADFFDIVDKSSIPSGANLKKGPAHLEPLDSRRNLSNPKQLVVGTEKKPLSKGEVKYTIIRTKRSKTKTEKVVIEMTKASIGAISDTTSHTRNTSKKSKIIDDKEHDIRVHEEERESVYNKADDCEKLTTGHAQSDSLSSKTQTTNNNDAKTETKEKVRFSPDEFDRQLRAAIGRSKKAKRMKVKAPKLGAIPEDVSESEDEDSSPRHYGLTQDPHRKVARRSSPVDSPTASSISLKPMLAAIPELTPANGEANRVPKSLSAIKVMRKTGSKEELLKHQQDAVKNVHHVPMSTQQFDGLTLMKDNKNNSAKSRARRHMRTGNHKMKIKFLKDLSQ